MISALLNPSCIAAARGAAAMLIALLASDTVDITAGLGESVTNDPFGAAVLAACRLLLRSI